MRHVETAWLIRNESTERWACIQDRYFAWTPDKDQALRFARAEDAIAVRSTFAKAINDDCSVKECQFIES